MKNTTDILELEGMEFICRHGCLEQEKENDNLFTVDFMAEVDSEKAAENDRLEDCIDLAKVYEIVADQMSRRCDLIETVANRIVRALEAEFPEIVHFSIRVSKKNPPLPGGGNAAWSRITVDGGLAVRLK